MKIHAIRTGNVRVRPAQKERRHQGIRRITDMLSGDAWTPWLPVWAWLIEHPEGNILVDTGETARVHQRGYHPRWHPFYQRAVEFSIHPDEELGPQLGRLGIGARDIARVVLTHLHTDHAGGLEHVAGCPAFVDEKEWRGANTIVGRLGGYLPHRWPKWWRPEFIRFDNDAVGPFDRCLSISRSGDVCIVPTPGHTPHHVSVLIQGEVNILLAGDASYDQELLLRGGVDGVSPSQEVALDTLGRIRELARVRPLVYLPSHDPDAASRLDLLATVPV